MNRIPLYVDVDNLIEIFSLERNSEPFIGMKQLISKESELIFCEDEDTVLQNDLYGPIAKELASGNYRFRYRMENEEFLIPPFKTNLQEQFKNKSTIFFSYDNDRVSKFRHSNGLLMAGVGEEIMVYNKLNFNRQTCKAFRFLIPGTTFINYASFEPYILPFNEIIINEPYLFIPDRGDWNLANYIKNNFEPLMRSLFKNVKNKVNIIICTFVNDDERFKNRFPYYDINQEQKNRKGFTPLYELCNELLKDILGGARFNFWLVISPMARKARHDRYILTNYQYIESGSGFSFYDDQGRFENRGEKIEFFSILDDQTRNELIPSVRQKLQEISVNQTMSFNPHRIFGADQGNSSFLNFL